MLQNLRRHRQRLGRSLLALFALAWLTVALQPCASAAPVASAASAVEVPMEHGHHGDHAATMADEACPPGADCPVFNAVEDQAATKAADPADHAVKPFPVTIASWFAPVPTPVRHMAVSLHSPLIPPPPVLEFRVLLI